MPDIKINEKNYSGVSEVQIPLADDSGNARFVSPQDTSWFEQVFRLVGEYDVATATNEDGSASSYVLKDSFVALMAMRESLGITANNSTFSSAMIVPSTQDETVNDLIFAMRGFGNVTAGSGSWNYPGTGAFARNPYFGFVKSFNVAYNAASLTQNFDITRDIEIGKVPPESDWVLTARKAKLYIMTFPLA